MKAQQLISLLVVSSYLIKSGAKLLGGFLMGIPALIADGLHSLFDIVEHIFLVIGGYFARKQDRENYPLDRQPLIDLLGLVIYAGLFIFGIALLWELVKLVITLLVNFGIILWQLPEFFRPAKMNIETGNMHFLLIASFIMLSSYVISELVYRFEIKLAKQHRLREMIADAAELRTDGWMELSIGVGLLIGWIVAFFFGSNSANHNLNEIIFYVNGIIMGGLGIYLMTFAWPQFWENFNNLMNRALEKKERLLLEKTISARLPIGCSIIEPLVCYHRGDQLFIKGHLSIDPGIMNSSDLIIRNAELVTRTFFSNSEKTIYVQFSPFFHISQKIVDLELAKVIRDSFKISEQSPAGEAFKLLRKGDLDKSMHWVMNNIHKEGRYDLLSKYVYTEILFRKKGAVDDKTRSAVAEIIEMVNGEIEKDFGLLFSSWLLIYFSGLSSKDESTNSKIIILRNDIEKCIDENKTHNLNDYLIAEAYFALGFSWERCSDYNLDFSRGYYRMSEYYYKRGGYRSEMDRLYNTWGHFETLTYSLSDAELHLNYTREIRETKNDLHGLTFTYGCLGDLYSRIGKFSKATEYYKKDIDLLKQLNIEHTTPGLEVKMAEQLIKESLLANDPVRIRKAIDICINAAERLNNPFFAYKAITKGFLGLSALHDQENERDKYISAAAEWLNKALASSPYEKAFWCRLTGRLAGYQKNFTKAQEDLIQSQNLFQQMKDSFLDGAVSIQSIASGLETYKWSLHDKKHGFILKSDESLSVKSLKTFLTSNERILGALPVLINEILLEYDLAGNDLGKRSKVLDKLIWFLEG